MDPDMLIEIEDSQYIQALKGQKNHETKLR